MASIEIVIKIDEKDYERVSTIVDMGLGTNVDEAIKNGVLLPKGHGDLIDKKVAYKKFYVRCLAGVASEVFAETPTIIEADKE